MVILQTKTVVLHVKNKDSYIILYIYIYILFYINVSIIHVILLMAQLVLLGKLWDLW